MYEQRAAELLEAARLNDRNPRTPAIVGCGYALLDVAEELRHTER